MAKNGLTSMTVSLPTSQKAYVKNQSVASGCSTPSEYIRRLIHADQRAREEDRLERMVLEGLQSPAREMTRKDWKGFRAELRRKATANRKAR